MKASLARLWQVWKELSMDMGDFQSKLLLTLVYFTCVAPFGFCIRLFGDPLDIRHAPMTTGWKRRTPQRDNMQTVRRQF